ncbi:uncharacterized protein ACA1_110900 [Acanthamoeba castellanii str. Neff]|uniref:Uncharacterized protein n=1 Tax=Acanthamoeba castellanii (strain ATCC 30010 / Neff) TaxID=1257118 RepID=L8H938_ACACF|nr:uncharacterized protein ACA1_110900 [Acanthamoeba castellanii str. Neff]ELR21248.1 hypothetical protein ACA1_110900 [Acanthamoeba castellanii str. Neff]
MLSTGTARAGAALAAPLTHGRTNQTYTEALFIINNRDAQGVWKLISFSVTGASVLTPPLAQEGVQPSDKWNVAYSFMTSTAGVAWFEVDYANGRSSPIHMSSLNHFSNTTDSSSDYDAEGGKGFLFSFDYATN